MRIKELEDALEAEREARMRVRYIIFLLIFSLPCTECLCLPTTSIIERTANYF